MRNVIYGLSCRCHPERGVRYVGLTTDTAERRLQWHRYDTNAGKTRPIHNWIRKHGLDSIETSVLEAVAPGVDIGSREVVWIAKLRADGAELLNLTDGGESTHGYVRPAELRAHSSLVQKGKRTGADNHFFGRKHTAEFRTQQSARRSGEGCHKAKLTKADVAEIRRRAIDESASSMAREFGVGYSAIRDVIARRTWVS